MDSPYSVHESARLSKRQKLQLVYDWVRKNDRFPNLSEDVTFICKRKSFNTKIRLALEENRKEKSQSVVPQFVPCPWQEKVLTDLENQSNRTVLWVFDFDGNSGKTELAKYLCRNRNFQQLVPGGWSKQAYRSMNDEAEGYVIDYTRHHPPAKKIHVDYKFINEIKDGDIVVRDLEKMLRSTTVVIFANFLPDMSKLSMDRWSFFHTKLGPVYLNCIKIKMGSFYDCSIAKKNECTFVDDINMAGMKNRKTDSEFLNEYFSLFVDQKFQNAMFAE